MQQGLPISVSCPVHRNINHEESFPLVSVSKGWTSFLWVQNNAHKNQQVEIVPAIAVNYPVNDRSELTTVMHWVCHVGCLFVYYCCHV